jgi:UDP-N-acetyl-D-mannosaminuronic acid transferase (WecB/TagA/CpsF family)
VLGVGAAFDFIFGEESQIREWMQSIGIEWFFRLCTNYDVRGPL